MRVELPNGQWAEFRDIDKLKAGDGKAIRRATKLKFKPDEAGVPRVDEMAMDISDVQMDALLARIITSWDVRDENGQQYGHPLADPSVLDDIPIDPYNALVEAAKPYKEKIDAVGKSSTANASNSPASSPPANPVTSP